MQKETKNKRWNIIHGTLKKKKRKETGLANLNEDNLHTHKFRSCKTWNSRRITNTQQQQQQCLDDRHIIE